ncbi:MAG: hypothetical protein Q9163_000495 [Psora crenata]
MTVPPPPSPPQRTHPSVLLPSSILSTPSFSSTFHLQRPNSASGVYRRSSQPSNRKHLVQARRRSTRSAASSVSAGSDGSLDDFSLENYKVDVAQLPSVEAEPGKETREERPPDDAQDDDARKAADAGSESEGEAGDILGDYTIDLGGLGEKPSSIVVENREVEKIEMQSEDDGPEDFTVNMGKWMRGDERCQDPSDKQEEEGESVQESGAKEADGSLVRQDASSVNEESLYEPCATPSPASRVEQSINGGDDEHGGPKGAPPFLRSNTQVQEQAAAEVFDGISALQDDVERMRAEDEVRREAYRQMELENERLRRELEDDMKRQRRPNPDDLSIANDKIEGLKSQLESAQGTINTLRAETESGLESHQAEVSHLRKTLQEQKDAAETERNKSLTLAHEAAKLAESRHHNEHSIQRMKDDIKTMTTELDNAHNELRETRRVLEDVEDENDQLALENARQAQDLDHMHEQLQTKTAELQTANATMAELRMQVESHHVTEPEGDDPVKSPEDLQQEHEAACVALEAKHAEEMASLRSALQKASQGMRQREAALKKSHNEQVSKLQHEMATMKQAQSTQPPDDPPSSHFSAEDELRSAIRVLSNKLERANVAARAARAEVEAARQRADSVNQANQVINAELEARFAETIEAREREWMRRANLLLRERDKMGKALLQGWGREELGPAPAKEKQAYRYKYVKGRF